jgi:DNA-binding response OmpR family regulator
VFDIADDGRARAEETSGAAQSTVRRQHRILVVEDSLLLAELICDSLEASGYSVVGPAVTLQAGCALARTEHIDAAVLDLKLGLDVCFPIAVVLKARGIPFVIVTGHPMEHAPPGLEPAAWIAKPMGLGAVTAAVYRMLAPPTAGPDEDAARPHKAIVARQQAALTKAVPVRVLLVDGDPRTRGALAALLTKRGFDVQCLDGHQAPQGLPSVAGRSPAPPQKIVCGKLIIDLPQRRVWWDGADVPLTAGEFSIVVLLARHAGHCVDNRTVYDCLHHKGFVAGHGDKGFWVNVRSAIRHIRRKFRAVDGSFDELENARAFGYRWRKPS